LRSLAPVEVRDEVQYVDLVGEVEIGRRFVQQQDGGALGDGHRDPRALPLAAGELVDRAVGEVGQAGRRECRGDGLLVRRGPLPPPGLVR
jgi:hypothetical protein